jgi:hypothetical protein
MVEAKGASSTAPHSPSFTGVGMPTASRRAHVSHRPASVAVHSTIVPGTPARRPSACASHLPEVYPFHGSGPSPPERSECRDCVAAYSRQRPRVRPLNGRLCPPHEPPDGHRQHAVRAAMRMLPVVEVCYLKGTRGHGRTISEGRFAGETCPLVPAGTAPELPM